MAVIEHYRLNFGFNDTLDPVAGNWMIVGQDYKDSTDSDLILKRGSDDTNSTYTMNQVSANQIDAATANGTAALVSSTNFPEETSRHAWDVNDGDIGSIQLKNLDNATTYNILLFSSKSGSTLDYQTRFTIQGSSQVIDAKNANTTEVLFSDITPQSGIIQVDWQNDTGTGVGYINALILEENEPPIPPAVSTDSTFVLSGGEVRVNSEIVRFSDTLTLTASDATADSYTWTIHDAEYSTADITSGVLGTNIWNVNIPKYGKFDITLHMVKGADNFYTFQEGAVTVVPDNNQTVNQINVNIDDNVIINASSISGLNAGVKRIVLSNNGVAKIQPSGRHIQLLGLKGTATEPIHVVNADNIVFTGDADKRTVHFEDCEHMYIDGFGVSEVVTNPIPSSTNINPKRCGIFFEQTSNKFNTACIHSSGESKSQHVHIFGCGSYKVGTTCKIQNGLNAGSGTLADFDIVNNEHIHFHHNYCFKNGNEPIYWGSTSNYRIDAYLNNYATAGGQIASSVYRNHFIESGKDAVQIRWSPNANNLIHHNRVKDSGNDNISGQNSVFSFGVGFGGRCFSNIVDGCKQNFTNSNVCWYSSYIYNNVVVNMKAEGGAEPGVIFSNLQNNTDLRTFDPTADISQYYFNNLFHHEGFRSNEIWDNAATDVSTIEFTEQKLYNNIFVMPNNTPQTYFKTRSGGVQLESNNLFIEHENVISSNVNFNGGYLEGSVWKFTSTFNENGDLQVVPTNLTENSVALGAGDDLITNTTIPNYPNTGVFPTYGRATDLYGIDTSSSFAIGPYAISTSTIATPVANISATPADGVLLEGETIDFNGSGSLNATIFEWDFGTGIIIASNNPAEIGSSMGTEQTGYTVRWDFAIEDQVSLRVNSADTTTFDVSVRKEVVNPDIVRPIIYKLYSTTRNIWIEGIANANNVSEIDATTAPDDSGDTVDQNSLTIISYWKNTTNIKGLAKFDNDQEAIDAGLNYGNLYLDMNNNVKKLL